MKFARKRFMYSNKDFTFHLKRVVTPGQPCEILRFNIATYFGVIHNGLLLYYS